MFKIHEIREIISNIETGIGMLESAASIPVVKPVSISGSRNAIETSKVEVPPLSNRTDTIQVQPTKPIQDEVSRNHQRAGDI